LRKSGRGWKDKRNDERIGRKKHKKHKKNVESSKMLSCGRFTQFPNASAMGTSHF
jgi:hypothetical protein